MVFPQLSNRAPLRLYDWPDDIFGVLKEAGIAQAGYVPMAVMPADRERTHAPIRKFMRSRRHSEPACNLRTPIPCFKNSMARRRCLSNDTADPWGLIPHSLTPFHYLRKGK
jgi:hypothetical protein